MPKSTFTRTLPVVGVAAALAVAGCSGGGSGSAATSGTVQGAITYSFWGSPARAEKVNKVIGLYQQETPGVTVTGEVSDYNAYIEKMTVKAAGGGLACAIGTQSTFFAPYAQKDVLLPLDDLIASKAIDVANIPKEVLAAGQIDGKQYLMPTGTFVRLAAYNVDMVKAAGGPAPTDDMTWEQYAAWLKQVQAGLPKGKYASEIEGSNMFSFSSWVIGHGQQMFKDNKLGFDKALMAQWFQYWLDLTAAGVTVPASMIPDQSLALEQTPLAKGVTAAGTRDIPQLFVTEKALTGAKLGTSVKAVSIPSQDPTKSANIVGSNGISIPKSCDNPATAASWLNYFTNDKDAALAFQSDNGILTNTANQEALLADPATPAGVKQNVTILWGLTDKKDLTTMEYPAGLSTLTTELTRLYQQVAFGQTTVDAAVDAFFNKAEQVIK